MEIKEGKTYKVWSLEWIKKHCDREDEISYYFSSHIYSKLDENVMSENRLVIVTSSSNNNSYCIVESKEMPGRLYILKEVLYTPVLDIIKKISEAINKWKLIL